MNAMKLIIIDRIVSNNSSAIRLKRTNGSTTKLYVAGSASASVPCNHTEIRVKFLIQ